MKTAKTLALMAMGGMSVIAYQKYNKPLMKKISKAMDKVDNKLEEMI